MTDLIKRVEECLRENWPVDKADIQKMLDYIKQNTQNHENTT